MSVSSHLVDARWEISARPSDTTLYNSDADVTSDDTKTVTEIFCSKDAPSFRGDAASPYTGTLYASLEPETAQTSSECKSTNSSDRLDEACIRIGEHWQAVVPEYLGSAGDREAGTLLQYGSTTTDDPTIHEERRQWSTEEERCFEDAFLQEGKNWHAFDKFPDLDHLSTAELVEFYYSSYKHKSHNRRSRNKQLPNRATPPPADFGHDLTALAYGLLELSKSATNTLPSTAIKVERVATTPEAPSASAQSKCKMEALRPDVVHSRFANAHTDAAKLKVRRGGTERKKPTRDKDQTERRQVMAKARTDPHPHQRAGGSNRASKARLLLCNPTPSCVKPRAGIDPVQSNTSSTVSESHSRRHQHKNASGKRPLNTEASTSSAPQTKAAAPVSSKRPKSVQSKHLHLPDNLSLDKLAGHRAQVYWSGDDEWYSGTFAFPLKPGSHSYVIHYDDGDKETISMPSARVRLCSPHSHNCAREQYPLLGRRVHAWWKQEKKWFAGTLVRGSGLSKQANLYTIKYDDGDFEDVTLPDKDIRVLRQPKFDSCAGHSTCS